VLDDDNDRISDEFNTKARPLHGDAPRGVLTVEDRAQVAAHKAELVALLQAETGPAAATLTVSDALGVFPGATIVRGNGPLPPGLRCGRCNTSAWRPGATSGSVVCVKCHGRLKMTATTPPLPGDRRWRKVSR